MFPSIDKSIATTINIGEISIYAINGYPQKMKAFISAVHELRDKYEEKQLLKDLGAPMATLNNGSNYTVSQDILNRYNGNVIIAVIVSLENYLVALHNRFRKLDSYFSRPIDMLADDFVLDQEEGVIVINKFIEARDKAWQYIEDYFIVERPAQIATSDQLHDAAMNYYDRASRVRSSGTYIVAPSVGALIYNREMSNYINNRANIYVNSAENLINERNTSDYHFYANQARLITSETLKFVQFTVNLFLQEAPKLAMYISGPGSESREWQNIRMAPCSPESYVDLLNVIDSSEELDKLLDFFEVDKAALVAPCKRRLATGISQHGNVGESLDATKKKYAPMLKNLRHLANVTPLQLFSDILHERMDSALLRVSQFSYELPNMLINRDIPEQEISQQAAMLTRNLISREDFLFFHSTFGTEWDNGVSSRIPHTPDVALTYDDIIELYRQRIVKALACRKKKDEDIRLLEEQQIRLETNLATKGFFALRAKKELRQQIEDKRREIRQRNAAYKQEIRTI